MALDGLSDSASSLLLLIGKILAITIFAIGLFFLVKYTKAAMKKRKAFKIDAHVSFPDGSHILWKCGKFRDKDKLEKMLFMRKVKGIFGLKYWAEIKGETMPVIEPSHIVSNTVHLFRYGVAQYAVIPPTVYRDTELTKQFNIKLINQNMLHWKGLEQRAQISRWAAMKNKMQELTPWIVTLLILVLAGVAIYFLVQMGITQFDKVTATRMAECSKIIGGGSAPIDAAKSVVS